MSLEDAQRRPAGGRPTSARPCVAHADADDGRQGMAPLPPLEMVIVVCGLTLDADDEAPAAARETLGKLA